MSDVIDRTGPETKAAKAAKPGEEGNPAKRREILDGARQVFRSAGFDGASMDQIARAAGVSKGTLYVYFRNKEDLFLDLVATDKNEAAEQLCRFEADGNGLLTTIQSEEKRANYEKLYRHLKTLITTSGFLNSVEDVTRRCFFDHVELMRQV